MIKRSSGILMHIASLPSEFGIGDFGKGAYEFIDFLEKSNQKIWQILPLGPTGYGDSPYQSFSAFAGNPYFIDLKDLVNEKLIENSDLSELKKNGKINRIDYGFIYNKKLPILRKAYEEFKRQEKLHELNNFKNENNYWIVDYSLYMALKNKFNNKNWLDWPLEYKNREKEIMEIAKSELIDDINYHIFLQFQFFKQWLKIKKYANDKNIKIIGDIPIFVALDSADAWSKSEMFLFDENKNPEKIAGCPPDFFSETGQLWGNPLYNWDILENEKYGWWIERVKTCFKYHDIVRIDHFRGFESYWAIPVNAKTAVDGKWEKGPGMKLFNAIKKELGNKPIIAEDLGFLTPEVKNLLEESGYPGMKILIFAFNAGSESDYLPHKYSENCVAYTGTHDNDTVLGWYIHAKKEDKEYCDSYLRKIEEIVSSEINWKFIEAIWNSKAMVAIAPIQDIIGLDNTGRINTPSTSEGNWNWRLTADKLTDKRAERLRQLTIKSNR